MKERLLTILLLFAAAATIWALVADLPKKKYAQPSSDFTNHVRGIHNASSSQSQTASAATTGSKAISSEVIRLHILADSDSETDQAIKLAVRDALLPYLHAATQGATTKQEAMARLQAQCNTLKEVADNTLAQLGTTYTATVSMENLYFPIRIYGSQTYLSADAVIFPPGFYDSVQVILGTGEGHNWWCLAYPSLCFIDATYDYIPKDSDLYKLKLSAADSSTLTKLFYGEQGQKLLKDWQETMPPEQAKFFMESNFSKSKDNTTVTVYFGSKLFELLRALFSEIQVK